MAHKTAGLRGKLRLLTIIGFSLVLLVCGGIVALFLFDIEDVIYARGKIASEIAYDIIGHMDGRVIRLNFEEGDDVEAGEVIAQLDTILYDEQRVRIEAELREYEAELEVKKRNGLMRLVGAIIVFVVITAVKETLVAQGVAIASDMMVNALFYITALVLAGVAGFGSRDYVRANGQLRAAREKLGK